MIKKRIISSGLIYAFFLIYCAKKLFCNDSLLRKKSPHSKKELIILSLSS